MPTGRAIFTGAPYRGNSRIDPEWPWLMTPQLEERTSEVHDHEVEHVVQRTFPGSEYICHEEHHSAEEFCSEVSEHREEQMIVGEDGLEGRDEVEGGREEGLPV